MKVLSFQQCPIPGLGKVDVGAFPDNRGYFAEFYRASDFANIPFLKNIRLCQANEVFSKTNVARGFHLQWSEPMGKLVRCLTGKILDVAVDVRIGSPFFGKAYGLALEGMSGLAKQTLFWIPPGFAHGYLCIEESIVEYLVSAEHSPGNEASISMDCQSIDWSLCCMEIDALWKMRFEQGDVILSDKDKNGMSLSTWASSTIAHKHFTIKDRVQRVLITGGCGFVAHHVVEHLFKNTDWDIIVVDKLAYASLGYDRLRDIDAFKGGFPSRIKIFSWDLAQPFSNCMKSELGAVDYILHMAAESHIDKSINDPVHVAKNNFDSSLHLLEWCRTIPQLKAFVYFSTDKVFGPAPDNKVFVEHERHQPTTPYSASKSAGEQLTVAYGNTYGVPYTVLNVMNAFGERQCVENFLPKCVNKVLAGEKIKIHSYPGMTKAGSRFYIHARTIAAAIMFILESGAVFEKYNLSGEREISNLEMAEIVADELQLPLNYEMVDVRTVRSGHDLRYGLDDTKIRALGFKNHVPLDTAIRKCVQWFKCNRKWLISRSAKTHSNAEAGGIDGKLESMARGAADASVQSQ